MFTFRTTHLYRPAIAAMLFVALTAPARAAEMQTSTFRVSYGDLNLASQDGVGVLRQRLLAASRSVCGNEDNRDLAAMSAMQACRAEALEHAMADLHRAVAVAQSRTTVASAAIGN